MTNVLTITEMASLYGVSLRTLRFYEGRRLLRPERVGTARLYTAKDCIRLELILKGKRLGFSLSEIEKLLEMNANGQMADAEAGDIVKTLSETDISQQLAALKKKRDEIDSAISELQVALQRSSPKASGLA